MTITASVVKELRERTGAGMMDCKKALVETNGDFDAAIDLLRTKGQKVAAKRADREAKEGIVATGSTDDAATAILVEVNCETDFVARNEDFQAYAAELVARTGVDPATVLVLGASTLFLLWVVFTWVI